MRHVEKQPTFGLTWRVLNLSTSMTSDYIFSSESVGEGHPDKVCDTISDAVLDACLAQDPGARVACETLVNTGMAVVSGEISTEASIDIPTIVRDTVRGIGYDDGDLGYAADAIAVLVSMDEQSPEIAQGVVAAAKPDRSHIGIAVLVANQQQHT